MSGFLTHSSVVKLCCAYPQTCAPTSSRPPKSNKAGFCESGLLFLFHHYPNRHISHGVLQSTCKKKKKKSVWFVIGPFQAGLQWMREKKESFQQHLILLREKLITWRHSGPDGAHSGFFIVPIHNIPLTGQSKLQYPNFSQRGNVNPCMAATLSSEWGGCWRALNELKDHATSGNDPWRGNNKQTTYAVKY